MPRYRFEFETFDTGCVACPFAVKVMNKDGKPVPERFRCTVKHRDLQLVNNVAPDWCPLEMLDNVEKN